MKPVIKWAGGKRQIINELVRHFPEDFNNYYEPFVGGGSVFMYLAKLGKIGNNCHVFLSDIMLPLISMYEVIRDVLDDLVQELSNIKYANEKDTFERIKNIFNEKRYELNKVELVAIFIYLNKTSFNGLYRENSKGNYNVPFGKQTNPAYLNVDLADELRAFLRNENVHVKCESYEHIEERVESGDFIYMDPPYYSTFTQYTSRKFVEKEQVELRDFFQRLCNKGCKVALSNSDHPFIRNLYAQIEGVRIIEINVKRFINSKGEARKNEKKELLIINY
jgi:DNA adenine methylase